MPSFTDLADVLPVQKIITHIESILGMPVHVYVDTSREDNLTVSIRNEATCGAVFSMSEYPGNCGIIIFHSVFINSKYCNRGIGQFLHQVRLDTARECGYTLAQCTTKATTDNQNHILRKNGWSIVHSFINQRTNNRCFIWQKEL